MALWPLSVRDGINLPSAMKNTDKLLVLLRIYLGLVFLFPAYAKLFGPLFAKVQIEDFIGRYAVTHAYEWYRGFLQGFVMHHVTLFGTLVTMGEWYIVVAMLFGITTRLAAGIAVFMLLNFVVAKGNPVMRSPDLPYAIIGIVVMLGAAGRVWGVDQFLYRRYPRAIIW
jgi:uncharacterized membrane protein YphA (DoxX/SURF4 family)